MKVSIITAVRNNAKFVEGCLKSVFGQTHNDIEHIVIDGASTDGTLETVNSYKEKIAKIISEKDEGPFYAMNKGLRLASGDIIGLLHADDLYEDKNVITRVVQDFTERRHDCLYGDLVYVDKDDINRVIRYWRAGEYDKKKFERGWMVPHPTLFIRREAYHRYGVFDTDFKISADYELMLRFLYKSNLSVFYLPRVLIKMRLGGQSNRVGNIIKKSFEDYLALKKNGMKGRFGILARKNLSKISQFFRKA